MQNSVMIITIYLRSSLCLWYDNRKWKYHDNIDIQYHPTLSPLLVCLTQHGYCLILHYPVNTVLASLSTHPISLHWLLTVIYCIILCTFCQARNYQRLFLWALIIIVWSWNLHHILASQKDPHLTWVMLLNPFSPLFVHLVTAVLIVG